MPFGRKTGRSRIAVFEAAVMLCEDFAMPTLRLDADHGELKFDSAHLPVQICGLRRYACGKVTGCQSPIVIEAVGIGFHDKGEEARLRSRVNCFCTRRR
jgi:hypothetical protein